LKSFEKQQLEIKEAQLRQQTKTERGEVNLQISGLNLIEEIWYG